jgi:hypothetical protein
MASIINADSSNGLTLQSDTSGIIEVQSGGVKVGEFNVNGLSNDSLQNSTININGTATALGGTADLTQDYIMLAATGASNPITYTAGSRIDFRTVYSNGISNSSGLLTVSRAGTYLVVVSLLCNTGTAGTNGDGRIRHNGADFAAFYAFASDLGTWEKSVGTAIIECAANDTIDFKMQSDNAVWSAASGYTHSPVSVLRIGD